MFFHTLSLHDALPVCGAVGGIGFLSGAISASMPAVLFCSCAVCQFVQRHQGLFEAPLGFGITEIAGLVQPLEAHNAGVVDQNVQVWMLASDLLGKPPDRLVLFYVELDRKSNV